MPPNLEIPALAVKGNQTFAASRMHGVYLSTNDGTIGLEGIQVYQPTII